jgi:hypothetical protein
MFAQAPVGQDHGDSNFAANEDLALGVWAEGAAEAVLHEEFLTSAGLAPDRSTGALPSSTAETSAKAPQKLPNGVLTLISLRKNMAL